MTPAGRNIAELLLQSLPGREMAQCRGCSFRVVRGHLFNMSAKFNLGGADSLRLAMIIHKQRYELGVKCRRVERCRNGVGKVVSRGRPDRANPHIHFPDSVAAGESEVRITHSTPAQPCRALSARLHDWQFFQWPRCSAEHLCLVLRGFFRHREETKADPGSGSVAVKQYALSHRTFFYSRFRAGSERKKRGRGLVFLTIRERPCHWKHDQQPHVSV